MKNTRKPLHTLQINEFRVPVSLADNFACGGVEGEFRTKVKLSVRKLTDEGFVIEVGGFMDSVRYAYSPAGCNAEMLKASCEELASGVVNVAHRDIGERLERVVVEVANLTGGVEIVWHKGQEIPNFPRAATDRERNETLGLSSNGSYGDRQDRRERPRSSC